MLKYKTTYYLDFPPQGALTHTFDGHMNPSYKPKKSDAILVCKEFLP